MKHYNEYKFVLINDNVQNTVMKIKIIEYDNLIIENNQFLEKIKKNYK